MKKADIIKKIQAIITDYGTFTTADVQAESSPCVSSKKGRNELCETFSLDDVEVVVTDKNDEEIDRVFVDYDTLEKDVLVEILALAEDHEVISLKDEGRQGNKGNPKWA